MANNPEITESRMEVCWVPRHEDGHVLWLDRVWDEGEMTDLGSEWRWVQAEVRFSLS